MARGRTTKGQSSRRFPRSPLEIRVAEQLRKIAPILVELAEILETEELTKH